MDTTLVQVFVDPLGSALIVDAAVSATQITVDNPLDFTEGGGQLSLNGVVYEFDAADPETGVVTLSTPLTVAGVIDDPVEILTVGDRDAQTWFAQVEVPESDEPIDAEIPTGVKDYFQLGDIQGGATVRVEPNGRGGYEVTSRPGEQAGMDLGSAFNVPDPAAVAVDPPEESPAFEVQGNATGLVVVTEPIQPTTLLDFYINGNPVATDQRTTIIQLSTDGTGNPLAPDTDYTVTVQAHNTAGDNGGTIPPVSAGVTARLDPTMTAEKVQAIIKAGFILAGIIQVGSSMTLDPTGGFTITMLDGRQTYFRADGSGNQLIGQATLDSLIVLGNMLIQGTSNSLAGLLTALTGVGNPTAKPGVTTDYDSITSWIGTGFGYTRGLVKDGANWCTVNTFYGGQFMSFDAAGGFIANTTFSTTFSPQGGLVKVGSSWYILGRDSNRGNAWWVFVYNSSWVKTGEWAVTAGVGSECAIGLDGSTILIANRNPANSLYLDTYSTAGVSGGAGLNVGSAWGPAIPTGIHRRTVDGATVRWVVVTLNNGIKVFDTATGARVNAEEWLPASSRNDGMAYDGTNWHTFDGSKVYHYTNLIGTWDFAFTWRDDDATGGTAETMASTLRTVAPTKRARWTISLPSAPPDDLTTNGANTGRLYAAPTGNTLVLQASLIEPVLSQTFSTLALAGAGPPGANGFASRPGSVGRFVAAALDPDGNSFFDLRGDGAGSYFGPWGFDANLNAVGRNGAASVWAEDQPSGDASPTGASNITIPGLSLSVSSPGTRAVYEVRIGADIEITTAGTCIVELLVDGVAQAVQIVAAGPATVRGTHMQEWTIIGLSAGSHTFTARTRMVTNGTGATVTGAHTKMKVKQT